MTSEPPGTLLDASVLFALVWDQHVHHGAAHARFRELPTGFSTTAITESGLVRLLLTPAVTGRVVAGGEALGVLAALQAQPGWRFLADDTSLAASQLDLTVLLGRRQVTDLHLVGLCAAHDHRLATFDAGLAQGLAPADRRHVCVWS